MFLAQYTSFRYGGNLICFKYYESVFDLLTNIPQFTEPSIYENFNRIFSKYINKCQGHNKEFLIHVAVKIPL